MDSRIYRMYTVYALRHKKPLLHDPACHPLLWSFLEWNLSDFLDYKLNEKVLCAYECSLVRYIFSSFNV